VISGLQSINKSGACFLQGPRWIIRWRFCFFWTILDSLGPLISDFHGIVSGLRLWGDYLVSGSSPTI